MRPQTHRLFGMVPQGLNRQTSAFQPVYNYYFHLQKYSIHSLSQRERERERAQNQAVQSTIALSWYAHLSCFNYFFLPQQDSIPPIFFLVLAWLSEFNKYLNFFLY